MAKIEYSPKNLLTPYPPKGELLNSMILRCPPLGLGVKHLKINEFSAIQSRFNIQILLLLVVISLSSCQSKYPGVPEFRVCKSRH